MLHIITIETNVDSQHCLNKYIICKMTARIVCPRDHIRICLQSIYDLEKTSSSLYVRKSCYSPLMIKPSSKKTMKVIFTSIHHNFTLIVCCYSVSLRQQWMLEISVFYTHLQSEARQMPKQNFVQSCF